jgi:hypothetical protein
LRHPADHRAWRNAKPARRRLPAHPFPFNRHNRAFAKILRIRSPHSCRPPSPASILNLTRDLLGIPYRFLLNPSRSNGRSSQEKSTLARSIPITEASCVAGVVVGRPRLNPRFSSRKSRQLYAFDDRRRARADVRLGNLAPHEPGGVMLPSCEATKL